MTEHEAETAGARRQAVALRYERSDDAPRVVARGYGRVAETIIERARAHDLAVYADADLVQLLAQVDLEACIPPALYQAVAELLAWLYELDQALADRHGSASPASE